MILLKSRASIFFQYRLIHVAYDLMGNMSVLDFFLEKISWRFICCSCYFKALMTITYPTKF